jgi:predicted HAD superfamily Cof-like phosphohydrolase
MSIESINLWHSRARPTPDAAQFNVQLGCHLEEIVEMLEALHFTHHKFGTSAGGDMTLLTLLSEMADEMKAGRLVATVVDRKEFLDAIADQVVTGVGAAYCAGMDAPEAVRRVDSSNWSKFVDGQPVFDENGKIAKGPYYKPVDLAGTY